MRLQPTGSCGQRAAASYTAHAATRDAITFYLMILPWIIGFLLFTIGPILASFALSFTQYEVVTPPQFRGLENYARMLEDPLFRKSLYNTFYYVWFFVPLHIIIALGMALLLNQAAAPDPNHLFPHHHGHHRLVPGLHGCLHHDQRRPR